VESSSQAGFFIFHEPLLDVFIFVIHNVSTMKTATIRQIRNTFPEILAWVQQGEEVIVLNRKTPVARICPLAVEANKEIQMPDFEGRAKKIWGNKTLSIAEELLQDRGGSRW
jgi:antitoxin (DNA-binding transcriptional repressor) of toxin-antitoxin stability system